MTTLTFDTLGYAKKLEAAGFTRQQAEVQAEILREHAEAQNAAVRNILDSRDKDIATKADIERVRADMKSLELRLLKWQLGIGAAGGSFMLAGFGALAAIIAKGFGWIGF